MFLGKNKLGNVLKEKKIVAWFFYHYCDGQILDRQTTRYPPLKKKNNQGMLAWASKPT